MYSPRRFLLVAAVLLAAGPSCPAAVARGRVACAANTPVAGVAVSVVVNGRRVTTIFTGADGSYYLSGLPSGPAVLQVWQSAQSQVPAQSLAITLNEQGPAVTDAHLPACNK